jgi:hypothetical protein
MLSEEERVQSERRDDVRYLSLFVYTLMLTLRCQLETKVEELQENLVKSKQELDNQQSERTRIAYAVLSTLGYRHTNPLQNAGARGEREAPGCLSETSSSWCRSARVGA